MKAITKIFILFLGLHAATWIAPQKASAQLSVDFQIFYDDLSPYGNWVDNSDYGYVWSPDVSSGFSPYSTRGHWIYTYAGWTWVSDYSWGWAPFHYGRWDYDNRYGWMWIPGYEWGPSWVSWREYDGYYGWAPMGSGLTINISFGRQYNNPNDHWIFVRERDFYRPNLRNYIITDNNRVNILQSSRVIRRVSVDNVQHRSYMSGPSRTDVQKATGKSFNPVMFRDNGRSEKRSNEQLNVKLHENRSTTTKVISTRNVQQKEAQRTPANNQRTAPVNNQRQTPVNNQRNVNNSSNERNKEAQKSSNEKANKNNNRK